MGKLRLRKMKSTDSKSSIRTQLFWLSNVSATELLFYLTRYVLGKTATIATWAAWYCFSEHWIMDVRDLLVWASHRTDTWSEVQRDLPICSFSSQNVIAPNPFIFCFSLYSQLSSSWFYSAFLHRNVKYLLRKYFLTYCVKKNLVGTYIRKI